MMVSYLDVGIIITSGQFIYDKRDSFNFPIVNFPFMSSNIPAYGIYISQLVRIRNMTITSRLIKVQNPRRRMQVALLESSVFI